MDRNDIFALDETDRGETDLRLIQRRCHLLSCHLEECCTVCYTRGSCWSIVQDEETELSPVVLVKKKNDLALITEA